MMVSNDIQTAIAHAQAGNHKAALKAAKSGMKRNKAHPVLPNIAAIALCALGREREAVPYFQKALKLDPAFYDARRNLGIALIALNQNATAIKVLSRCLDVHPNDRDAALGLCAAQRACGQHGAALVTLETALEQAPQDPALLLKRAQHLEETGEIRAAIKQYQELLAQGQNSAETLFALAGLLTYQMQSEPALDLLRQAVAQYPESPEAQTRLAMQLLAVGERATAMGHLQQALALDPSYGPAWLQRITGADRDTLADFEAPLADALIASRSGPLTHAHLQFAQATLARQIKGAEAAIPMFSKANAGVAALKPYDRKGQKALNAEIMRQFATVRAAEAPAKDSIKPIFVTGLPRSGTTLVEAVLGAHPSVLPLGERRIDESMVASLERGEPLDTNAIDRLAQITRNNLPDLPAGCLAYVDKMPENHRFIGILAEAFPEAIFVNLSRDPRDIALSQWQTLFGDGALPYTYDLGAMAHRFNLYAEIMQHWHEVMPGRILNLSYEGFVGDIETGSKDLANHCGLIWDAQMMTPHAGVGQVLTASREQVRHPVNTGSIGRWQPYAEVLRPLVDGLDPALWPGVR